MSYFWIFLIVLVAMSPLIKAMPTRRQRDLANLRQAAANCGLFVQYRNSPLEAKDAPQKVYYGRRRSREHPKVGKAAVYARADVGWRALEGAWSEPRLALLDSLPAGVSVASEEIQSAGVIWDERGDLEEVARIDAVLKGLLESTE